MTGSFSFSGNFICSEEQIGSIKYFLKRFTNRANEFSVSSDDALKYLDCWYFPEIKKSGYIFFAGEILLYAKAYLVHQILEVVENLHLSPLEEKEIAGRFYYKEDNGNTEFWMLDDDGLHCYGSNDFYQGHGTLDNHISVKMNKRFEIINKISNNIPATKKITEYFGVEVADAKVFSDFPLSAAHSLETQWPFLNDELGALYYDFRGFYFVLNIYWIGDSENVHARDNYFCIKIYESRKTQNRMFYEEYIAPDLKMLEDGIRNAVNVIEYIKKLDDNEILNYRSL